MLNTTPIGNVEIAGTAFEGQQLNAETDRIADAEGVGTFSFKWLRAGEIIQGATGASYTLTPADIGTQITARVSYVDGQGNNETFTSTATDVVASTIRTASRDTLAVGSEFQINTYTDSNQSQPSVTALSDGGFVVTWRSDGQDGPGYGVYGQRFDAAGTALGDEFEINTYTDSSQSQPSVTALPDGGFVVTWQSDGQDGSFSGIYGQRFDAAGVAQGVEFRINTYTDSNQSQPSVTALPDGGFVVTWASDGQDGPGYGVYGQRFDAAGTALGDEFEINTETTGDQTQPSVTALPDGGFVVAWQSLGQDGSGFGIYGQRYDAAGVAQGDEFQINTYTDSSQFDPSVTALPDGGFVVTWRSDGQDGSIYGVFGQRYDAAGVAQGNEFQINTYTNGSQLDPSVTALPDGGFVVTWTSNSQDGSIYGVFGQRYDAAGAALGVEFQINTYTDSLQFDASVTALPDGGFVVTWQSDGQDGSGYGIYGQRFASNTASTGIVEIAGTAFEGQQLTAETDSIADADGLGTFSFEWLRAGVVIEGATGASYTLTPADIGTRITARVSYVDDLGTTETITSTATDVVASTIRTASPDTLAVGSEFPINTENANDQSAPSVTALSDGGFVVTWQSDGQDGSGFGIYGQRYNAAGMVLGDEFQINAETDSFQWESSVTGLPDGGFVVTWTSDGQDGSGFGVYGQRFDAAGAELGAEFRINTVTTGEQRWPSVTSLSDGGFMVTWTSIGQDGSGAGIYGQRIDAAGTALGGEFRINTETANGQFQPSVTALSEGGFVVTWTSEVQDGSAAGIYGQRYDAAGVVSGDEFQINTYTNSFQSQPSVTALPDGGFVVTWMSDGQDGSGYGIYGQRYDAAGVVLGAEFQINTEKDNIQSQPSVTALPDGGFVVTWQSDGQDGDEYGIFGQRYDAAGTALGDEFQINTYTDSSQSQPSVTALPDGGFVVTWQSDGQDGSGSGIYGQRFASNTASTGIVEIAGTAFEGQQLTAETDSIADADGLGTFSFEWLRAGEIIQGATGASYTLTPADIGTRITARVSYVDDLGTTETITSTATDVVASTIRTASPDTLAVGSEFPINTENANDQSAPSVTALSDGGFVVTWQSDGQDGSGYDIYGQRYDAAGVTQGDEFPINSETANNQYQPSVTGLPDGGFVVTWVSFGQDGSGFGIYGQRYDAAGVVSGDEFQINTYTNSFQYQPSVTALPDGSFVVTWMSDGQDGSGYGIYGQRYDAAGVALGDEFQINTYTDSSQSQPSVTALPDGSFVVTWMSDGQDGSGYGIYGQRYDAAGVVSGDEFQINTYTNSFQSQPSVTALPDGGFVVTWNSNGQDGSGYGIYGQRYDAAGVVSGNEFQINTYTDSSQVGPSVTALPDGGFVVTWTSNGQDGDEYGIFGQRYDAAGMALDDEFQINTETANDQYAPSVTGLPDGGFVVTWQSNGQDGSGSGIYGQRFASNTASTGIVEIAGTAFEGQQLTAETDSIADADGLGTFSFEWLRAGEIIQGATGASYTLTSADIGTRITARVSYVDDLGTTETITSTATDVVASTIRTASPDTLAVGSEFPINTENANNQSGPSVTALSDGGFVVTWQSDGQDGSGFGIYGQRYNAAGVTQGDEFPINSETANNQYQPSVTGLPDGGFVVTWVSFGQDGSGYGIFGQRYDAAGMMLGDEFRINIETANDQRNPSVTGLPDGGFVVTWNSNGQDGSGNGIYGQRYDAAGVVSGNEFEINTYTDSSQVGPSVTALPDGGFVVTWTSNGQDGSRAGIYGQRYDAAGMALDDEFQINTETANDQYAPSVTGLPDGGFVVTWQSNGQDGSAAGIYGQRYDAAGMALDDEFQINTETANDQSVPSVTALSDGGFVVTWTSDVQDGSGYGIYGQRYDAAGMVLGDEFQINAETDSFQWEPSVTGLPGGGFVVTWTSDGQDGSGYGIYGQRFESNTLSTGFVTIDGTIAQDQTLTAVSTLADADGIGTLSFQWLRAGEVIADATAVTYVLNQDDVGAVISVRVSYTDELGFNETVSSGVTAAVANVNDLPTGGVTIDGAAAEDATLTAVSTLADEDGFGTLAYQWLRDGAEISGATGASLTLTQADVGAAMSVRVSYTDGQGAAESVVSAATAAIGNINDLPTGGVAITGSTREDGTLSAVSTLEDEDGLGTLAYQWLRDGAAISGATGASFTLTQADVGATMSVRVSYTDDGGTAESVVSVPTSPIANINDLPTGAVTVTGSTREDGTLSAVSTLEDEDGLGTLAYQWLRDEAAISGATGASFTLTQADVGATMSVRVSYTDDGGTAESVVSAATAAIAPNVTALNETGTGGPDTFTGTILDDKFDGLGGNDTAFGGEGDDGLKGGDGDDSLDGGPGNDKLPAGAGNDTSFGGEGNDRLGGGNGNDYMDGGPGNDGGGAGPGNDTVIGGDGNDRFNGGYGNDLMDLGTGDDTSGGSFGDDTMLGGAGNDSLGGGNGNDSIDGGAGNDTIISGFGDDTVTGGTGADVFVFNSLFGGDTTVITDFEDGIDTIRVTGLRNPADPVARLDITDITYEGQQAVEMTYGKHTIIVLNTTEADFSTDDFLFT